MAEIQRTWKQRAVDEAITLTIVATSFVGGVYLFGYYDELPERPSTLRVVAVLLAAPLWGAAMGSLFKTPS